MQCGYSGRGYQLDRPRPGASRGPDADYISRGSRACERRPTRSRVIATAASPARTIATIANGAAFELSTFADAGAVSATTLAAPTGTCAAAATGAFDRLDADQTET